MTSRERNTMLAVMNYLYLERDRVHYPPIISGNIERQQTIHNITTLPQLHTIINTTGGLVVDCSQTSQLVIQIGIGRRIADYDVTTKWFLDNLPHYHTPNSALIGGPCVWGSEPGHHMALVHTRGRNPVMFSHGHDPLELIPFSAETIAQGNRPWTFTSIAAL